MKKRNLMVGLAASVVALTGFAACGSKSTATASDSDSVMTEVEETSTETLDQEKYGKEFFTDEARRATTPSDSTWMQTDTGLKYVVVTEGSGKAPLAEDEVTVHYTGRLLDGTVFDSSVTRGEPATFPLNRVIPGWTEGLQLMKEGGKTVFYIPSALGYGPQGAGPIPPDSDLIFEVELIKVN